MRKLLLFSTLALMASSAFSQTQLGFQLGLNSSVNNDIKIADGDEKTDYSANLGLNFGIMMRTKFNDFLSLRHGVLYSQKGSNIDFDNSDDKIVYNVNSLMFPINLVAGLKIGPGAIQLNTGPTLNLNMFGKAYSKDSNGNKIDDTEYNIKGGKQPEDTGDNIYVNFLSFGWNIGAGLLIEEKLLINFNFEFGLTDMEPHYEDSDLEDSRKDDITTNNTFSVNLAYFLGGN